MAEENSHRVLSPREAFERFLNHRRSEFSESSISTYRYRLKLFVEWCESEGIDRIDALDGWILDDYQAARQSEGIKTITLNGEMKSLRQFFRYLERIEVVDEGTAEKIHVPTVPKDEESSEVMLDPAEALPLLRKHRSEPGLAATRTHAYLELSWHTGARLSGLRSLDTRDFHRDGPDGPYLEFHHRPSTGTPLKNGNDGERPVGIPEDAAEIVEQYIDGYRNDIHDDYGRAPLITSQMGRASRNTIRNVSYLSTFPCIHRECPHGRDPDTCDYIHYHRSSQCPSSRSPHQVRTGSITWQRDIGFPPEVIAERVNASLEVIDQYYDKASALDRLERRRRQFVDTMDIEE